MSAVKKTDLPGAQIIGFPRQVEAGIALLGEMA
jgi:hypothetical protein